MRNFACISSAAVLAATLGTSGALAQAPAKVCDNPKQMKGFKTCADVTKAETEGTFVQYSTEPEKIQVALLKEFTEQFPKIKPTYIRLQAGALYAKLRAERNAKTYLADVMQLSDMGMAQDFQRNGGWKQYISPELPAFKAEYRSKPDGFFQWGVIIISGIAYNPNVVKPEEAPKSWEDLTHARWKDAMNVKVSNSGLQMATWYVLKPLLAKEYWDKLGELKPRAFDSYVQQYGRLVDGQDKVIMGAQYSGFVEFKAKGAPLEFVAPATGLPAAQQSVGIVANNPNPNAAELYMDWLLGVPGQTAYSKHSLNHSPREDVPPPPGAKAIKDMKILFPANFDEYEKSRPEFVKEWDKIVGARK